jgi:hypothetical protein
MRVPPSSWRLIKATDYTDETGSQMGALKSPFVESIFRVSPAWYASVR